MPVRCWRKQNLLLQHSALIYIIYMRCEAAAATPLQSRGCSHSCAAEWLGRSLWISSGLHSFILCQPNPRSQTCPEPVTGLFSAFPSLTQGHIQGIGSTQLARFRSFWWSFCQTVACLHGVCSCLQRKLYSLLVRLCPLRLLLFQL